MTTPPRPGQGGQHPGAADARPAAVVVLAAGEGTRMRSRTPKVLHQIGGRSLLGHAVDAAAALGPRELVVVVGHGRDRVCDHLAELAADGGPQVRTAVQEERRGTGHAVRTALAALPELTGTVLVTYGDVPLLSPRTLGRLAAEHAARGHAATVLTAELADPAGYGRVLRDRAGELVGIAEDVDATPDQRRIREVNSGIYAFEARQLAAALARVQARNGQAEEYLTDVLAILSGDGCRVGSVAVDDHCEVLGVNDRRQLAQLGRLLNDRVLAAWMEAGVSVVDPASTWVDVTVTLAPDVLLQPGTMLHGTTVVAPEARIGPDTTLLDTTVEPRAEVLRSHATGSWVGPGARVGPFAHLRPGTRVAAGAEVGAFVETKNAELGERAKVRHLAYVGDATVGAAANVGAGAIVANYDGLAKHRTTIGAHSFIGSDVVLVAPVEVADGAYVAAGSTIVGDVPPGALAVARGRQRVIDGWVERKRPDTPTAAAARAARHGEAASEARADTEDDRRSGR